MPSPTSVEALLTASRQQLEGLQACVPGFELCGDYQARLHVAGRVADVRFEAAGWGRVTCPLDAPLSAAAALARHCAWSGNLRYALSGGGVQHLVADFRLDGLAHLPRTFAELGAGLREALGEVGDLKPPAGGAGASAAPPAAAQLQERLSAEIARLPFGPDGVVRLERAGETSQWELRPRVAAEIVPVRLTLTAQHLRLSHVVLRKLPAGPTAAVADQALRYNASRRLCRLAQAGDDLVVESLLHEELWAATWLADAAQAVATACRHVYGPLEVLAQQAFVARSYLNCVCAP